MHWVLTYDGVDDFLERRAELRAAHLEAARAAVDAGDLVMAGGLGDPPRGSMFVFRTAEAAASFAAADPYVTGGIVREQRIERWTVVVGLDAEPI